LAELHRVNNAEANGDFHLELAGISALVDGNIKPTEPRCSVRPNIKSRPGFVSFTPWQSQSNTSSEYGGDASQLQYPIQSTASMGEMELIPVELNVKGIYEEYERPKNLSEARMPYLRGWRYGNSYNLPTVWLINQLASTCSKSSFATGIYRERQKERMEEMEERLTGLEKKHGDLNRSYESLHIASSKLKQELVALRKFIAAQNK
jgi:hypothetical protein